MLGYAFKFNQDLSAWNISSSEDIRYMFRDATEMLANQGVDATPDSSYFVGKTKIGTNKSETLNGKAGNDI